MINCIFNFELQAADAEAFLDCISDKEHYWLEKKIDIVAGRSEESLEYIDKMVAYYRNLRDTVCTNMKIEEEGDK